MNVKEALSFFAGLLRLPAEQVGAVSEDLPALEVVFYHILFATFSLEVVRPEAGPLSFLLLSLSLKSIDSNKDV